METVKFLISFCRFNIIDLPLRRKLKNIGVHWDFENVPSEKDMEKAFSNATKNGLPQPIYGTWVRADYE